MVGNNGDGQLSLLTGGPGGLSLTQTLSSAEAPNPTGLSFAGVSDGLLSFYVSTAGHEAALSLAFDLDAGPGGALGRSARPWWPPRAPAMRRWKACCRRRRAVRCSRCRSS